MSDVFGLWVQAIGGALLWSPLGASELIVGLLVATTFVGFAIKNLVSHQGARAWDRHESSPR